MSDNEFLKALADGGAAYMTATGITQILAHAEIANGTLLLFPPFPEMQDVRRIRHARTQRTHGRDFAALSEEGRILAYVCPLAEMPDIDTDEANVVLAGWRHAQEAPKEALAFYNFVASYAGRPQKISE